MEKIAIFTKSPEPGRVKTRFTPPLNIEDSSTLYTAFFCDCVLKAASIVSQLDIHYDHSSEILKKALRDYFPGGFTNLAWVEQDNGDLGARISNVPAPAIILFADAPTLPVDYIGQAVELLDGFDIAIGPAIDGGCYLIGFNPRVEASQSTESLETRFSEIFQSLPWGTSEVSAMIRARAELLNLSFGLLPPWYDVDTVSDLKRLKVELETLPADSPDNCPCTRSVMKYIELDA
jgi:hypothetical protein